MLLFRFCLQNDIYPHTYQSLYSINFDCYTGIFVGETNGNTNSNAANGSDSLQICELQAKMTFSALLLEEVLPLQISHPHIVVLLAINFYCTLSSTTSRDNGLQFVVKLPNANAIWQSDFPSKLSLPQTGSMGKRFIKAVTPLLSFIHWSCYTQLFSIN